MSLNQAQKLRTAKGQQMNIKLNENAKLSYVIATENFATIKFGDIRIEMTAKQLSDIIESVISWKETSAQIKEALNSVAIDAIRN